MQRRAWDAHKTAPGRDAADPGRVSRCAEPGRGVWSAPGTGELRREGLAPGTGELRREEALSVRERFEEVHFEASIWSFVWSSCATLVTPATPACSLVRISSLQMLWIEGFFSRISRRDTRVSTARS